MPVAFISTSVIDTLIRNGTCNAVSFSDTKCKRVATDKKQNLCGIISGKYLVFVDF